MSFAVLLRNYLPMVLRLVAVSVSALPTPYLDLRLPKRSDPVKDYFQSLPNLLPETKTS